MKKSELIVAIHEIDSSRDELELKKLSKEELEELYEDLTDDSDMYPNGRDYDAEDEDF